MKKYDNVLITSDWHFGARAGYEIFSDILEDTLLNFIFPTARKHNAHVIVAGDIFDNRSIMNIKIMNKALKIFDSARDIKFTFISGNHDMYYKASREYIGFEYLVESFSNIEMINEPTIIENKFFVPWIKNKNEAAYVKRTITENNFDAIFGHFAINSFEVVRNYKHNENGGWNVNDFNTTKQLFTGHYHILQEKENITYMGSPYSISWNDEGYKKGCFIYNNTTNKKQFIENTICPKFIKIYTSLITDEFDFSILHNNFIKLIIDSDIPEHDLERLRLKCESYESITFEIENKLDDSMYYDDDEYSLDKLKNSMEFLSEYVLNVDLPESIKPSKLISRLKDIHGALDK